MGAFAYLLVDVFIDDVDRVPLRRCVERLSPLIEQATGRPFDGMLFSVSTKLGPVPDKQVPIPDYYDVPVGCSNDGMSVYGCFDFVTTVEVDFPAPDPLGSFDDEVNRNWFVELEPMLLQDCADGNISTYSFGHGTVGKFWEVYMSKKVFNIHGGHRVRTLQKKEKTYRRNCLPFMHFLRDRVHAVADPGRIRTSKEVSVGKIDRAILEQVPYQQLADELTRLGHDPTRWFRPFRYSTLRARLRRTSKS